MLVVVVAVVVVVVVVRAAKGLRRRRTSALRPQWNPPHVQQPRNRAVGGTPTCLSEVTAAHVTMGVNQSLRAERFTAKITIRCQLLYGNKTGVPWVAQKVTMLMTPALVEVGDPVVMAVRLAVIHMPLPTARLTLRPTL